MARKRSRFMATLVVALAALLLAPAAMTSARTAPAATTLIVGGIHVGSVQDAGYNQAEHQGLV